MAAYSFALKQCYFVWLLHTSDYGNYTRLKMKKTWTKTAYFDPENFNDAITSDLSFQLSDFFGHLKIAIRRVIWRLRF